MNLTFDAVFELMKLFTEEDWEILFSESFSPVVKLSLAIDNKNIKQQKNKIKHLAILNFCKKNKTAFKNEKFDAEKFTIEITKTIYSLNNFVHTVHEKKLKDIKTRLSEIRKLYIYPFFGLKEIISNTTEFDLTIEALVNFDRSNRKSNYFNITSNLVKSISSNNYLSANSAYKLYKFYDKQARHQSVNNNLDIKQSIEKSLFYFNLYSHFERLEKILALLNMAHGNTAILDNTKYIIKKPAKKLLDQNLLLNIDYNLYVLLYNELTNKKQAPEKKVIKILKLLQQVKISKLSNRVPYKAALNSLKNFCIIKGVKTSQQYLFTALECTKILDDNKLLTQRGKLNHVTFKNLIVLFLEGNQPTNALNFYNKYENLLQPDKSDISAAIKNYALGLIYIDLGDYKKAGRLLSEITTISNFKLQVYYRQALLLLAIQNTNLEKNPTLQKSNLFLKSSIKSNEIFIKKNKTKTGTDTLKNLIEFTKNHFYRKNKKAQPKLTLLQERWLSKILKLEN